MKKIFTSLLLLAATVVTANAEMKTVWEGTHEIGNWGWDMRLELTADHFSALQNGDKMVISMSQNVDDAGNEPWYQYDITANDYVENRNPQRTPIASGDLSTNGDITINLTDEQVSLLKNHGMIINGHFVTITKIAIGTEDGGETPDPEPGDGTTTEIWQGSTSTGEWAAGLELSYENKPTSLATAKVGDLITVTCTTTGDDAQVQIANPEGWQPFDEDAHAALPAGSAAQTFSYEIPNVATLELIQFNGIVVKGKNITISKVELTTYPESYDAVEITIGDAGIATYSNSSKSLDFTNADVTAYYATAVETGKVTLTPVTYVPAYTGIIVKGTPGPHVVMTGEGENNAKTFLKP